MADDRVFPVFHILRQDGFNLVVLFGLYLVQGIPIGLATAVPYLLRQRGLSYTDQATFSLVLWPFSLKLLWAPIVDGAFINRLGRRKSWLLPIQMISAAMMYFLSKHFYRLIEGDVNQLTLVFFILVLLSATQDIVVDGWSLTMLSKENRNLASTVNKMGQATGYVLGYGATECIYFCNQISAYVHDEKTGEMDVSDFLRFWAWAIVVITVLMLFKSESDAKSTTGVGDTYKLLYEVINSEPMMIWIPIVLTSKVAFAAIDAASNLKFLDAGLPEITLSTAAIPIPLVQVLLPALIAPYTAGNSPLEPWLYSYSPRLVTGVLIGTLVYFTPLILQGMAPTAGYVSGLMALYMLHHVTAEAMSISQMSFFARIADARIGATYMTLLNTIANFSGTWPVTVALWAVDPLSQIGWGDGFFVMTALCSVIGIVWAVSSFSALRKLQQRPPSDWLVKSKRA